MMAMKKAVMNNCTIRDTIKHILKRFPRVKAELGNAQYSFLII